MNPVLDMSLSFEARGIIAYLQASQQESITVEVMRSLGLGRDKAYRVACELERSGHFLKSGRSGYIFRKSGSSAVELPKISNFLISGNQEVGHHAYESRVLDSGHVVAAPETFGNQEVPDFRESEDELQQPPLIGLSEAPTPSSGPPPPPKPRRGTPATDAVKALYPAVFELCKSGQKGGKSMACRNLARDLHREFAATAEQVAAFWEWFKVFSRPAQIAAREQRTLNAPMPRQVYEDWPQFLEWWRARQADIARRAEAEARRRSAPESERPGDARRYNPFRNRLSRAIPVATD